MQIFYKPWFLLAALLLAFHSGVQADDVYRLRMFFGLSIPTGGGVSIQQWEQFERDQIATTFDGFNVVDSVGYWKGQPERSKIVTLIGTEAELAPAKDLAQAYAKQFHQDSVMLVRVPVSAWDFISAP